MRESCESGLKVDGFNRALTQYCIEYDSPDSRKTLKFDSENRSYNNLESESEVVKMSLTLCHPMDCSPPGSSVHGFSRQEYWSGLPCPPPGDLPDQGIESGSPAWQEDSLPSEPPGKPIVTLETLIKFHTTLCSCQ